MIRRLIPYLRVLLLFLISGADLFAQSRKELDDSLTILYQREDFQNAIPIARRIVEMSRSDQGDSTTDYATALNNLGHLLHKNGNKTEAIKIFAESLVLRMKLLDPDHEDCFSSVQSLTTLYTETAQWKLATTVFSDYINKLIEINRRDLLYYAYARYQRADIYYQEGNLSEAESDYLEIIKEEKNYLADTALLANSYNYLVAIYSNRNDIAHVENIFIRNAELRKLIQGPEGKDYIYARYQLAALYSRGGEYQKSADIIKQVTAYYKKTAGVEDPEYQTAVFYQVSLQCKLKFYEAADSSVKNLLHSLKENLRKQSENSEQMLYLAGNSLARGGAFNYSLPYLKQSIEICRKLNKPALLANRLGTLDSVYKEMQRYEDQVTVLSEIIDLHEKYNILTDSAYTIRLGMLARVYYLELGLYSRASELALKIDQFAKKAFSKTNELYILSRQVLGNLYVKIERIDLAEKYYLEALELAPAIWKNESDEYAALFKVIAAMYYTAGQYKKAYYFLQRAIEILEKNKSEDYALIASTYYNISNCTDKGSLNDSVVTESALKKAVFYSEKSKDGLRSFIGYSRMLALYYTNNRTYEKADSIYDELLKKAGNADKSAIKLSLSILAEKGENLFKWGKKEEAGFCIRESINKSKLHFGDTLNWEDDQIAYIGEYYLQAGQYREAIAFWEVAFRIAQKKLGTDNPGLSFSMVSLIHLYLEAGEFKKAESIISSLNRLTLEGMAYNFDVLSDSEKEKYISNKLYTLHFNNSLLLRKSIMSERFVTESMNQLLLLKGLVLAENRRTTESVLQSGDTSVQRIYHQWLAERQILAKEYSKPAEGRRKDLKMLEEQAETLQKEMTKKSAVILKQQRARQAGVSEVQKRLAPDEAAIEFVYFRVFRVGSDSSMYAAYILRPGYKAPVFVPLCESRQLTRYFDSTGKSAVKMADAFYRGGEAKNRNNATYFGNAIYQLLWKPMEPYLKGVKKISYTPAGKLYDIAFHALPVDSNSLLMDKYELNQYMSTRQVALRTGSEQLKITKSIALFGDATFTLDSTQLISKKNQQNAADGNIYNPAARGLGTGTWSSLPGTAEEVKKISQLFKNNAVQTSEFVQKEASEENLKALSGQSPQVLHIATHGFFLPDPEKDKKAPTGNINQSYEVANDPLLRSGLILAGANYSWEGKTPIEGIEDGIATAYEISQLNLSNTELVVLSACETALGDIRGNEGVFGLQRAFKMAGVKKMIVSLWQVPDKETAELMTAFYGYWLNGNTINEAFTRARAEMRKKYSPYYWAAFVLVE